MSSSPGEKDLQPFSAFGFQHPFNDLKPMIERTLQSILTQYRTPFRFPGAKHKSLNPGVHQRPGAHGAGFYGDVQRRAR